MSCLYVCIHVLKNVGVFLVLEDCVFRCGVVIGGRIAVVGRSDV